MRCNAGIPPEYLFDQHLIAEYRELFIPLGQLRKLDYKTKTPIPETLRLGKGHVVFWRDKQKYLARRHKALVEEMKRRGFQPNLSFWDEEEIPSEFWNDWEPTLKESQVIRMRIREKVLAKPTYWRMWGKNISEKEAIVYVAELPLMPLFL